MSAEKPDSTDQPDDTQDKKAAKSEPSADTETASTDAAESSPATPKEARASGEPKTASTSSPGGKSSSTIRWVAVGLVALVVATVALIAWPTGKPTQPKEPTLELAQADQTAIVTYARNVLEGKPTTPLPPSVAKICGRHVFVQLFRNAKENYVYAVSDTVLETKKCMPDAIESAVARLKQTRAYDRGWKEQGTADSRLAVSITSTPLKSARIIYSKPKEKMNGMERKRVGWRLHSKDLDIGKTGLYLRSEGNENVRRVWAPPMQGVVHAHGREDNRVHLRQYSAAHFRRVGFNDTDEENKKPNVRAYTFQTVMMLEKEPGSAEPPIQPVRGNIPYGRVDADDIYDTGTRMTDYLVRIMDDNGKFDYEYYADQDTSSKSYNIVRHAGTTYSLLFTYSYTGDKKYLDAGLKAKNYIIDNLKYQDNVPLPYHGKPGTVPAPFPEADGSVKLLALVEGKRVALGATALSLLAFSEIPTEALEPADAERIRHMVNLIWYLQCESGGFYTDYDEGRKGVCPDPQPLYFPGESLLALNSLYRVRPDPAYLKMSEKSIGFELQRFYDGTWPDHWVMQALDLLDLNLPEKSKKDNWVKAANEMAEKYIASQYMYDREYAPEPPDAEYEGGYQASAGPPRNTPTGSRSEAVAGIWRLLKRHEQKADAEKLGDHLLAAAYFLTQEMYRPENMYYLKNPAYSLWGLRGSMIDPTVRIDFNQHAIVGIWGAWEVALDRKGIGWPIPEGEQGQELRAKADAGKLITKWGTRKPKP